MQLSDMSKAIAGGITGALLALVARYGYKADGPTISLVSAVVTAVIGYAVGHVGVYLAPANTVSPPTPPSTPPA